MEDVAVLDDVFFAFLAHLAGVLARLLAAQFDEALIGDGFGADEAAFEIGVDGAGGFGARALRRTVQARASLGPTVKKVIRSKRL